MGDRERETKSRLERRLEAAGISRRHFLKYCGGLAAALAIPGCGGGGGGGGTSKKIDDASTSLGDGKPAVVWLNGLDCNGCSVSFLNLEDDATRGTPSIASVILDTISLRYHEAVMAGAGEVAEKTKADAIRDRRYILVVEGAIPAADDAFCTVGGVPIRQTLLEAADRASYVIALGSCATSGGVVKNTPTQGRPVTDYVTDRTVINLPMCPANGEHLLLTILSILDAEEAPPLDDQGRPRMFFEETVHARCPRLPAFVAGNFLTDWNDPVQRDYCLFDKGCRGPLTVADCPTRGFNGGVSHCTASGAPCQGCAEPDYYDGIPLYAPVTLGR